MSGWISTNGFRLGALQAAGTRRVCVPDWYCASTRPVVRKDGIVVVRLFAGLLVLDRVEARAAVVGREAVEEQARRAGMVSAGQGQNTPSSRTMRS